MTTADQAALIDVPAAPHQPISERHIQAVAAAMHQRWGPCEDGDCDGGTCHVTLVREILEQSANTPVVVPTDALTAAHEAAWRVACCYGDLVPDEARQHLPSGSHMALSEAHLWTVVARVAAVLRGGR